MRPSESEPASSRHLPSDVLVVEDNYLIALDTEEMLTELGVKSVRTAVSVEQALAEISSKPPEFCLLDVNLGSDKSFEVAERLVALGVPFAFATGYGERQAFPETILNPLILTKPYSLDLLRDIFVKPT